MFERDYAATAVRVALLGAAASAAMTSSAVIAEEEGVERIEVTGSRILRAEFESSSPISSFDASDIEKTGVTSVDEFLKFIPSTSGFQLGATTNNGNDGAKKIDVRGLGFNRTLVLINGKRTIGDVNGDGAVDLNQIPLAMVKRIDVLRDGASTIYGTDAIAGVVNIVLQDDFEGIRVNASYGAGMKEWDAEQKVLSILMGAASERGRITVAMEYNSQEELKQGERDWAHDALYPNAIYDDDGNVTGFKAVASGSSNSRTIRLNRAQRDAIVAAGGPDTGNWIVDAQTGQVRPFTPSDVYNYAPVNALITPNDRYQFALNGSYDISDSVTAYMDALYTHRESHQRLAPDASFGRDPAYQLVFDNAKNPFNNAASNPYGVDFSADSYADAQASGSDLQGIFINRRFTESGGRLFSQRANTFRMVSGLKGDIGDSMSWDVSYTYAYNEQLDNTKNYHRKDRWQTIVNESLCQADSACAAVGTLDPFSDFGAITPEQMAYLSANSLKDFSYGDLRHWIATLSGDTFEYFELPGGSVGWALGYEYRKEEGEFIPDEFSSEGLTTGGASDPQQGGFSVDEIYFETYLPVLDSLSFEAAVRYSDYDTSAGVKFDSTNYEIGFDWRPLDFMRFRGGYSTGFRAPNISELNQAQSTGFPQVDNICEFASIRGDLTATQLANCNADGYTGELGFAWQAGYTTLAPEVPLKPEESKSYTVGTVINIPGFDNLNVSVDYWNIEIDELIGSTDYQLLFNSCMDSVGYSAPSCAAFDGNNPLDGGLPADATFSFGNVGKLETDGIDLDIDYKTDVEWGIIDTFGVRFAGTYNMSRKETWVELGLTREMVGNAYSFSVFPEYKATTSFNVGGEDWNVFWDVRYISETTDALRPASITDDNIADSIFYNDINVSYNWKNVGFNVGVYNIFDEDAPRYHSGFNANTAPGTYDTIGRRLFAGITVDF
ncbi:TonB-dependent receptor [Shewanella submarina]|uniref:TonB-dependent receptor plug domain-containing protein n=1 Tax=Shewanella submarina TaxID=2016376 RepID=A0ABV7G8Y1_9GAMM|nr:TonB-dependent receptor [Shewanella submarina]MCL1036672.1 TonB-dependent receptor [Shewanella submarina]